MKTREQGPGIGDRHPEQGFMLLGLIVVIFIILLGLTVAAPVEREGILKQR